MRAASRAAITSNRFESMRAAVRLFTRRGAGAGKESDVAKRGTERLGR